MLKVVVFIIEGIINLWIGFFEGKKKYFFCIIL